jgi:hypothetical protein
MATLSGSEFKVLMYIVRRTFGFKKQADDISLKQICEGIIKRDGERMDSGTGLSKSTAVAAIKTLVDRGIITTARNTNVEQGDQPTPTSSGLPVKKTGHPCPKIKQGGYQKTPPPVFENRTHKKQSYNKQLTRDCPFQILWSWIRSAIAQPSSQTELTAGDHARPWDASRGGGRLDPGAARVGSPSRAATMSVSS